jgi:hypothetical protein
MASGHHRESGQAPMIRIWYRIVGFVLTIVVIASPAAAVPRRGESGARLTERLLSARQRLEGGPTHAIRFAGGSPAATYVKLVPQGVPCGSENRGSLLEWHFRYFVASTGQETFLGSSCLSPGAREEASSAPPPPTVAEIQDAVPLPRFDIATSPIRRGLTGLETWFWCDAPTTESVTVSIRGYRVVAEAHVVEFEWVTGDGHSYFSDTCGEEPDPEDDGYGAAARHTYETKDFYALELRIGWSGSYTFSGHGRRRTGDLGDVTTVSSRRYPVSEVRAVLVD